MSYYLAGGEHLQGVQLISEHVHQSSVSLPLLQQRSLTRNQKTIRLLFRRLRLASQDLENHLVQIDEPRSRLVEELDASRNHINVIPIALIRFTNLTNLILSSNNLTSIPYEIYSNTTQLRLLVLSENEIRTIPEDMPHFLTELVTLKLDDNRIGALPWTMLHLEKLQHLQLGSEYGGNYLESLPDSIFSLTALKELIVSYNRIHELPNSLFEKNTSLEYINLSHNYISHLPTMLLSHLDNLISLDLSYNQLSTISTRTLDDLLRLITRKLEYIDLSNNRLFILPAELLDQTRTQVIVRGNPSSRSLGGTNDADDNDERYGQVLRGMTRTAIPVSEYSPSTAVTQYGNSVHLGIDQEDTSAIDRTLSLLANDLHVFEEMNEGNISGTIANLEEENEEGSTASILDNDNVNILMKNDLSLTPLFLSLREIACRHLLSCITDISNVPTEYIPEHITTGIKNSFVQKCPVCNQLYVHEWVSTVQIKGESTVRKVRFCSTKCWKEYKRNIEERMRYYENNQLAERRQEMVDSIRQNPLQENTFDWIIAAVTAANEQEEEHDLIANM